MTLVVARIEHGRIAVVSDTLITEHAKPLPPQLGSLKSWIFPGNLCVSYSNSPELAQKTFKSFFEQFTKRDFKKRSGFRCGFEETIQFFEASSEKTGNDFLVAFDAPPRLVKIVDGSRRSSLSKTVWIGDQLAYEAFREHERKLRFKAERGRAISGVLFADEVKGSPASGLYSTFRQVIADRTVPTVGGFGCVISNRGNCFRFSVYSDMLHDWPAFKTDSYDLNLSDKVDLIASGENAGYAIAQISPGYIGPNCVAFYYPKSKSLFVYFGEPNGLANRCKVLSDVEPNDLKNTLDSAFESDFGWLALVVSAPDFGRVRSQQGFARSSPSHGAALEIFVHANTFPKNQVAG